jgi:mRNA interferase MazF
MPPPGMPQLPTAWTASVRRGDIVVVSLDPVRGSEASRSRPAVVVSNDAANTTATRLGRGVVTVVPVTSNVARVYPFQVLLPARETGLGRDSKAQAEQVRSVAVERIGKRLGRLPAAVLTELDEALRVHLAL